jgi:Protein of unknown function (DUF3093)
MRDYRERLRVPAVWWLVTAVCVLILGTELFAGYSVTIGVVFYVVLALICSATLLHWGGVVIGVSGGELRVDQARLPLARARDALAAGQPRRRRPRARSVPPATIRLPLATAGQVRPLDQAQTRVMRGPRANPAAYVLIRPYLRESVYVEVIGADARWPYLLIGTRHPAVLADAIERSRAAMAAQD